MRFIPVREFRLHPGAIWRRLVRDQELVLTARGRPVGLLTPLSEATFEETLKVWRRARGMLALEHLQQEAHRRGLSQMPLTQVNAEIQKVRAARRRAA